MCYSQIWFLTLVFKNTYYNIRKEYKCCAALNAVFCYTRKQLLLTFEFTIVPYRSKYLNQSFAIYALNSILLKAILHPRNYMELMYLVASIFIPWLLYANMMDVQWYAQLELQCINIIKILTKCNKPQFKEQHVELAPLLTIINEEEEYEVEEVQKHRKWGRGMQYLIYWKGYGDKHNQ